MARALQYANAHPWYKNLDKLIHYVNADGRLNVIYSSPEAYVAAKHGYKHAWPLKTDDFFPYADCPHCYWTGANIWTLNAEALRCEQGRWCFGGMLNGKACSQMLGVSQASQGLLDWVPRPILLFPVHCCAHGWCVRPAASDCRVLQQPGGGQGAHAASYFLPPGGPPAGGDSVVNCPPCCFRHSPCAKQSSSASTASSQGTWIRLVAV